MAKNKQTAIPHYELLYIVPNKYTEDDAKKIDKGVKSMIEKNGAKITFDEYWGKKKFCYPINHDQHGYYLLIEFDLEAEKIEKINTDLRMNNEVLRHMIVNRAPKTPEQIEAEKRLFEKRVEKATKKTEEKEVKKEEKSESKKNVDSKELDDKLNKILETDDLL